jgi:GT2 family glycosyltransferase
LAELRSGAAGYAAGVRRASAPIVAFAEDHAYPGPGWAEALVRAHADGWAAVGPVIANANPNGAIAWADFLLGYGPWLDPTPAGPVEYLPGHNSSYKRAALLEYGRALDELMEAETVLMWDLRSKGKRLVLEPAANASHTNFGRWWSWVAVMFFNGRAFAATRSAHWGVGRRVGFAGASPLSPCVRLRRSLGGARRVSVGGGFLRKVIPTMCVGLAFDAVGQMLGYAAGAGNAHERMAEYEWHRMKHVREAQPAG